MKETFTATQREIVARKMGYEGPMQGFDEFLMSTPSQAQRYSDITTKFSQKMARGGVVRRYADGGVVPEGQKKPSEIIQEYAASIGINPRGAIFGVDALMKTGDGLMLQEHNTVMVLQKLAPKVASANVFTTDNPKVLLSSISTLVDKLKESEINIIYGDKENEEFMLGLEYKGVSLYASDIPGNDWMAKL